METIENTVIKSYAERCKGMYPGYAPDGYEKLAAELNRLGSIRDAKHDALRTAIKTHGALTQQAILAQGEYDDAEKAFSELEKAITSGAAFTDQSFFLFSFFFLGWSFFAFAFLSDSAFFSTSAASHLSSQLSQSPLHSLSIGSSASISIGAPIIPDKFLSSIAY